MVELIKTPSTYENSYHLDPAGFNTSTWPREEDGEHIHKADLPIFLCCSGAMFYLCFIFMETSSQRVENACHTPITDQSVPSLLFPFFLVFYQKHHQANQNRRWLEPDLCVPSQNSEPEGRCLSPNSWHLIFNLERKHGHLPRTPSMESVLTALFHVHVNHEPLGIETSCLMELEQ